MVFFEFLNSVSTWLAVVYMLFVIICLSLTYTFIISIVKIIVGGRTVINDKTDKITMDNDE